MARCANRRRRKKNPPSWEPGGEVRVTTGDVTWGGIAGFVACDGSEVGASGIETATSCPSVLCSAQSRGIDAHGFCGSVWDTDQNFPRGAPSATQALRLVRDRMKMRRPDVRIEDERGNPVSFFQLKEMAEREGGKKNASRT